MRFLLGYPSLGENSLRFSTLSTLIIVNCVILVKWILLYQVRVPIVVFQKLFCNKNGYSDEYIIRLMAENQEREFERLGLDFKYLGHRKLQLIDCQNLFCETDKYSRVAYPQFKGKGERTRIKQLFTPNLSNPIKYFYPPKWKVNL